MTNDNKLKHAKLKWMIISAVALVVTGIFLILAGLIIPPIGEIHPSVLTALGEIFTFSGSLFGIDAHYKIKSEQINADLGTNNQENNTNDNE